MRTFVDAIDAVIAAVQARAAAAPADEDLAGLQVTFGHPGRDIKREGVIVGETIEDAEREQTSLGPPGAFAQDDERYAITVTVEAARAGGTQREVALRADRIAQLVEEAADDLTNAPPQWLIAMHVHRGQLRNTFTGEGRSSIYRLDVHVHARV